MFVAGLRLQVPAGAFNEVLAIFDAKMQNVVDRREMERELRRLSAKLDAADFAEVLDARHTPAEPVDNLVRPSPGVRGVGGRTQDALLWDQSMGHSPIQPRPPPVELRSASTRRLFCCIIGSRGTSTLRN